MGDYGIKISKPQQSVLTVADKDVQFSSKFSTLKIIQKGTITLTTDGSGNGTVTINHNLGYAPAHYVFRLGTAQYTLLDASSYTNAYVPVANLNSLWIPGQFNVYTTTTQLVISSSGQSANTTYTFKYYLFVDLAQSYVNQASIQLANNEGIKVSQNGVDVTKGQEYQMGYSMKYKSLQYYDVNYQTANLSLPELNSIQWDSPQYAGTYVDFYHGLGYQPFFLCWALNALNSGENVLVPFYNDYGNFGTGVGGYKAVDGFCDKNRVRISLSEQSIADPVGTGGSNGNGQAFNPLTVTIKCIIFTENLAS